MRFDCCFAWINWLIGEQRYQDREVEDAECLVEVVKWVGVNWVAPG